MSEEQNPEPTIEQIELYPLDGRQYLFSIQGTRSLNGKPYRRTIAAEFVRSCKSDSIWDILHDIIDCAEMDCFQMEHIHSVQLTILAPGQKLDVLERPTDGE